MPKIAALLTVHNRRQLTVSCLSAMFEQKLPEGFKIQAYVVDDASSDGTADEVLSRFPSVTVVQGDGTLYWGGGMRKAWSEASKGQYDYYLWLNDDTMLLPGAIATLLETASAMRSLRGQDPIVVGSTCDPETGRLTYGGKWLNKSEMLVPTSAPQLCDTINGNIVLIPHSVFEEIGNISQEFTHVMGDHDYSLRAVSKGIPVYVGPGYYGQCKPTDSSPWTRPEVPLGKRWRVLHSPKGILPSEYSAFARRHLPRKRLWLLLKLYARVVFPFFWTEKKFGQ